MSHWRIAVVLLSIVLCPVSVAAAPEGKVVIAQGVDPTTLDMTNQQEQASNVVPAIPLYQQIDLYGANNRVAWKARSDELIRAYDMALKDGK